MSKLLTGIAMVALSLSIAGCNEKPAENVAAEVNADMMVDDNAAMDANVAVDANVMTNAPVTVDTNNVTEQGSTDH